MPRSVEKLASGDLWQTGSAGCCEGALQKIAPIGEHGQKPFLRRTERMLRVIGQNL